MIEFDYQELFRYQRESKKLNKRESILFILFLFGLGLALIGAMLCEFDDKFGIIALVGLLLFIISGYLVFSTSYFPFLFHDYTAINNLQKEEVCYVGYEIEKEDVIRVYYAFIGATASITYHLYETVSVDNSKRIYEIMTNEMSMHEKNIYQLNEWIKKSKKDEEERIFKDKVSKLWKQDET